MDYVFSKEITESVKKQISEIASSIVVELFGEIDDSVVEYVTEFIVDKKPILDMKTELEEHLGEPDSTLFVDT